MGQRHKHADAIIAWAEGAEIERRADQYGAWEIAVAPAWLESWEYRIKPPPARKYRVALFSNPNNGNVYTSTADAPGDANFYEKSMGFIRWLTDWIEYEE